MVRSCCCLCLAQDSLYKLSTRNEFTPVLISTLSYILRAKCMDDFPFKYLCLDCIIQIHNTVVFLKKGKSNLKKLLTRHNTRDSRSKTDWNLAQSDKESHHEDEVFDDINIVSNWIDSQADYLRNLDTLSERASQTSVSCFNSEHKLVQCSTTVADQSVQTVETYSIKSNTLGGEATKTLLRDHKSGDKVGSRVKQKKSKHSLELSTSEPKVKKPNIIKVKLFTPKSQTKNKVVDTEKSKKKKKSKRHRSSKERHSEKKNPILVAQNVPLLRNLQTENVIHVDIASPSSLDNGLLTPVSEPLPNQDHNRETFDCKIDICEADLKAELISPLNQPAIDTPVFGTPRSSSLVAVTKTQILKICSVCDYHMYSSNEVRSHRKTHMQCHYCKKKFKSLTKTHVHTFYECDRNPLRCNVFLTKLDSVKGLSEKYPSAFSLLKEGSLANATKKKTDKIKI